MPCATWNLDCIGDHSSKTVLKAQFFAHLQHDSFGHRLEFRRKKGGEELASRGSCLDSVCDRSLALRNRSRCWAGRRGYCPAANAMIDRISAARAIIFATITPIGSSQSRNSWRRFRRSNKQVPVLLPALREGGEGNPRNTSHRTVVPGVCHRLHSTGADPRVGDRGAGDPGAFPGILYRRPYFRA